MKIDDFVVLDVNFNISTGSLLVIDLIQSTFFEVPSVYSERLELVKKNLRMNCVLDVQDGDFKKSIIVHIAKEGFFKKVYLERPKQIAAVVGRKGKQVLLAFSDGLGQLTFWGYADMPVSVQMRMMLVYANLKTPNEKKEKWKIKTDRGIINLLNVKDDNVYIFEEAIPVILSEDGKIVEQTSKWNLSNAEDFRKPPEKDLIKISPELFLIARIIFFAFT